MITILVTKESRAGETRVALVPEDVKQLTAQGVQIIVEESAGNLAGYSDQQYRLAGAVIRPLSAMTSEAYRRHFADIDIILRAKRPERARELLESQTIKPGTIMIGALDPLEHGSTHVDEYRAADIRAYSIDQLAGLPPQHPMNLLAGMSKIAGALAVQDAVTLFKGKITHVVIIGFGTAGRSAFAEACRQGFHTTVFSASQADLEEVRHQGRTGVYLDRDSSLAEQQSIVAQALHNADIVITSARRPGQRAPLLISDSTLAQMRPGSVIVDLALSEGGNVEGSRHDTTLVLGNQVKVTNTSGYPKKNPKIASEIWSQASLHFLRLLLAGDLEALQSARITETAMQQSAIIAVKR